MIRRCTVLVVCLGAAAWLNAALAQEQPIQGRQWTDLEVNTSGAAGFYLWRTTTLGTHKGPDAYRNAFDAAKIKIGDAADEILGRSAFPYVTIKTDVELALVSASDLGSESASSLAEVYKRAQKLGLTLRPAEVGPQLRLEYSDQPVGEALDIAMEPVATYSGELTVLALVNFGSGLALIGGDGRSGAVVPPTRRFVFALPTKGRLEARRGPQ